MQSLQGATNASTDPYSCAQELFDTVPLVMRIIRKYMRQHRSGLTVAQFRTIYCVSQSPQCSLSDVADSIGLSLPAMSRMVDGLVEKGYLNRRTCINDRRHVRLSVTPIGETALRESREMAQAQLAEVVSQLSAGRQKEMIDVMRVVRDVFTAELGGDTAGGVPCSDADPGKR
jgi:MarR family transcriptional regulator for hemolysin